MAQLLTLIGVWSLFLACCLFLAGGTVIVGPFHIKKNGVTLQLGIGIGTMAVSLLVRILLLVDIFTVSVLHETTNSILNVIAAVLMTLAALAAFGLAGWLACASSDDRRWLNAATALLGLSGLGFIAATLWLYSDTTEVYPAIDFIAQFAASVCFLLVFIMALTIAAIAYRLGAEARAPSKSG